MEALLDHHHAYTPSLMNQTVRGSASVTARRAGSSRGTRRPGASASTPSCKGRAISVALSTRLAAFSEASSVKGQPTLVHAKTVKGKGVPFMENKPEWHDKTLTEDLYEEAMKALS